MTDLQEIYRAVDRLSNEEKKQLLAYVDQKIEQDRNRKKHSQEKVDEIVEDMNRDNKPIP